ncbi:MAG TPA: hypothetical protein VK518_01455 [Puia sp.]|nr:hypothetical protein [Puia sp.]
MRKLFILPLMLLSGFVPGKTPSFLDPTGTYILKGTVKNNRVTGHSGELRVRLVNNHTVALCFYINSGYPGYRSGSLIDTLSYDNNTVIYHPVQDTACAVHFFFGPRKVAISKVMSDPRSDCGFAPQVLIPVTIPMVSSEIPVIQNLGGRGGGK